MTGKQKSHLRSLGQTLEPAVRVGKEGATQEVERALARALNATELVKVKFLEGRDTLQEQAEKMANWTNSEIVGQVGRTVLFFRRNEAPEARRIELPET